MLDPTQQYTTTELQLRNNQDYYISVQVSNKLANGKTSSAKLRINKELLQGAVAGDETQPLQAGVVAAAVCGAIALVSIATVATLVILLLR